MKHKKHKILILRSNALNPDSRIERTVLALNKYNQYSISIIGWNRYFDKNYPNELHGAKIDIVNGIQISRRKWNLRINFLIWLIYLFFTSLFRKYDVIHACDLDTYLPSLIPVKLKGKKIVYDIYDFFSDAILTMPHSVRNGVKSIDLHLMKYADLVIIADENRLNQINYKNLNNVLICYNSPPDKFEEFNKIYPKKTTTTSQFTLLYLGLMDLKNRDLIFIIDSIKNLPDIKFEVHGSGKDYEQIKRYANNYSNISISDNISYSEALFKEYLSDAILLLYNPISENNILASPNKLFEAMMVSTPIIINKEIDCTKIVKDANCGITFKFGNKESFINAISSIKNNLEFAKLLGSNGRKKYLEKYSFEKLSNELNEKYFNLISN